MAQTKNQNEKYLVTSEITLPIASQLKQLWEAMGDAYIGHSSTDARTLARQLKLGEAYDFILDHYVEYSHGVKTGLWTLSPTIKDKGCDSVVCIRFGSPDDDGYGYSALTNVPRICVHHSPTGHEWGYGGSGPNDLALDILNHVIGKPNKGDRVEVFAGVCSRRAWNLHRDFCREFIAPMAQPGGSILLADVKAWIEMQEDFT